MFVMRLGKRTPTTRRDRGKRPEFRPLRFCRYPAIVLIFAGCSTSLPKIAGAPSAPQVRDEPWRAPAGVVPAERIPAATTTAAADSVRAAGPLVLGQVVDMALRSNPQTAVSWAQARVGASQYGAVRGSLYPTIDVSANIVNTQTTSQTGTSLRSAVTPTASLSYVLLDFGGRAGNIAAARAAAVALDLTHNATLQDVALQAEASYFNYQATRSLLEAARLVVAEADTNLVSAQQRNRAGVATIADVLQAEVQKSQAQLALETAEGNVQLARGTLAVAMGLPANARFELAPVNDSMVVAVTRAGVDTLIDRALAMRPDLAALRMDIQGAEAEVRVAKSAKRPQLLLGTNFGKTFSNVNNFVGLNYGISLGVQIPIFSVTRNFNVKTAEAQVLVASARADQLRLQVTEQVYSAYYALQTATQRVKTSDVLLASATNNEVAARARYRAGVGTILDLTTALTALANARAQQSQARWVWATALAQLSHDVGLIPTRGQSLQLDSTGVRR